MKVVSLEGAQSLIRATLARALASAVVTGIDHAGQEGHELTQLQQSDVVTMAIMAYEEAVTEATKLLEVEATLMRARGGIS